MLVQTKPFVVNIIEESNNKLKTSKIFQTKLNLKKSIEDIIEQILNLENFNISYYKNTAKIFFNNPIDKNCEDTIFNKKALLGCAALNRNIIYLLLVEKKITPKKVLEPIQNYYFYEGNNDMVLVVLKLSNVEKVEKKDLEVDFTKRSIRVVVNNLDGKNFIFGVPKLHHKIIPEESTFLLKKDKFILKLKKAKKEPFTYLHAQKMIGKDLSSDEEQ
jgi:hypothetical protein